jgi:4-amino-4-deoxy-L-arabinose transferase-like glycosyltransferase
MMLKAACCDDRWWMILAAALVVIIFVFPLVVHFPLLDPDEGLHASIAQEMVERGDWLTPHFLGKPFLDKPILYFWCQAISLRTFGFSEAAVRLPGLIFGLLGAITTGMLGGRLFGSKAGWISCIFYSTMFLPAALAQVATHDVALVPGVNLALLCLWESDRVSSAFARWRFIAAAGLLLGLTILAKGLVGVAIVGAAYGGYILITRRLTVAICLRGLAVITVAALVGSTWFVAVEIEHPGFIYYYFVERHVLGFATGTQTHGEAPWWYYLPIVLGGGLPWIGFLPVTVKDMFVKRIKNSETESPHPNPLRTPTEGWSGEGTCVDALPKGEGMLLFCWLIGGTLLLSVSHSKLVTYIWPVFPAVAILAAVGWARFLDGTLSENARRGLLSTFYFASFTGPMVLPLLLFVVYKAYKIDFPWPVWIGLCLAGMAALVPLVFFKKQQWRAMTAGAAISAAVQFVAVLTLALPVAAEKFTARELAAHFNGTGRIPDRLCLAEQRLGSLIFYLDPVLRSKLKPDQIMVLTKQNRTQIPPDAIIVLPEMRVARAEKYLDLDGLHYQTVGRYRIYERE